MRGNRFRAGALAVVVLLPKCENSLPSSGPAEPIAAAGQMTVRLTDAPEAQIGSARVFISTLYVVRGSSEGVLETISTTPQAYELLDLQNGATATLGSAAIPSGTYTDLRLVVDSVRIALKPPSRFRDGSVTRTVRPPGQSGLSVSLSSPVVLASGGHVVVTIDFDVARSFELSGKKEAPNGVEFRPELRATVEGAAR